MKKKEKYDSSFSAQTFVYKQKYLDQEYPKLSIVVPTYNCFHIISQTIESVLHQKYPNFEIIIIDANSQDKTIQIVKGFRDPRIRIYAVSIYALYEMLNKGISQATGTYINFLLPGDYYLHHHVLLTMMDLALSYNKPHFLYSASHFRDRQGECSTHFYPLHWQYLKRGLTPTHLHSCWFRLDLIKQIGKFDRNYTKRGSLDLICKLFLYKNLRAISTKKIFLDYQSSHSTPSFLSNLTYFVETFRIIYKYFGLFHVIKWFLKEKEFLKLASYYATKLKYVFWEKKS